MSLFKVINGFIGTQAIEDNSATQIHDLGHCVRAQDHADTNYGEGEFIYAKGVASTVVGSAVIIAPDGWTTSLATADDKGTFATAMAATVAGEFGWYQTYGKAVVKVLASFADNANVYLTGTAGSVDDAVVAGDRVHKSLGASAIGTPSAGLAEIELNYPFCDDIAD